MKRGTVTKLVNTHGSTWGRLRPTDEDREVFFNADSLAQPSDFSAIELNQEAYFDERLDRVNGSRAVNMALVAPHASEVLES